MRIGFDLDNTIICYDDAFASAAIAHGFLPSEPSKLSKEEVKHALQAQGNAGVTAWQTMQGYVYGRGIDRASVFQGAGDCLRALTARGTELFIVSHKTVYGHFDDTKTNLRDAALRLLKMHGITALIPESNIFFCSTLAEKFARIHELRCDLFVDDLTDVLFHPSFPAGPRKILFRSQQQVTCERVRSWPELQELLEPLCIQ